MMRILVLMFFMVLSANSVLANDLQIIEADDAGQVILDSEMSIDDKSYIFNSVEPEEEVNVMQSYMMTTFNTYDYRNGFFDNPSVPYTISYPSIIDNENEENNVISEVNIKFEEPIVIEAWYMYQAKNVYFSFLLNGQSKYSHAASGTNYFNIPKIKIDEIYIGVNISPAKMTRFEIFEEFKIDYISAKNVRLTNVKDISAVLTFDDPDSPFFTHNEVYLDDVLATDYKTNENRYDFKGLTKETEYNVKVRSYYTDGNYVDVDTTLTTDKDKTPPEPIKNLKAVHTKDGVLLTYDLPPDEDFEHLRITRNGVLIASEHTGTEYIDATAKDSMTYSYRVFSYDYDNNISIPAYVTITTTGREIIKLKANVKADTVKLTWENPINEQFEDVTIYRKNKGVQAMLAQTFSFSATAGYTQLFRTNGTMFEDLTVASDTPYTYLLTSNIDGADSNGVTIDVRTPKVIVSGGAIEPPTDDTDSYTIKWTSPNTGKLMVKVGGVQYAIVNAADLQIVIPVKNMKFNAIGNPDVVLVPIDENGAEIGVPSAPGGNAGWGDVSLGNVGLDANTLLTVVVGLLSLVGLIILLAMSFRVTPKIIELISNAFK